MRNGEQTIRDALKKAQAVLCRLGNKQEASAKHIPKQHQMQSRSPWLACFERVAFGPFCGGRS